jgi:hypothetical protein
MSHLFVSVMIVLPGQMALILTPRVAHSEARHLTIIETAALLELY